MSFHNTRTIDVLLKPLDTDEVPAWFKLRYIWNKKGCRCCINKKQNECLLTTVVPVVFCVWRHMFLHFKCLFLWNVVRWAELKTLSLGGLGSFPPLETNSCAFYGYFKENAKNCIVELHILDITCIHYSLLLLARNFKINSNHYHCPQISNMFTTHNTYSKKIIWDLCVQLPRSCNIHGAHRCYQSHTAHSLWLFMVWQLVSTSSIGHYQASYTRTWM